MDSIFQAFSSIDGVENTINLIFAALILFTVLS